MTITVNKQSSDWIFAFIYHWPFLPGELSDVVLFADFNTFFK